MIPEPLAAAQFPALGSAVDEAIAQRYQESEAYRYALSPEQFLQIVSAVVVRYAADSSEIEQIELVRTVRVGELALARACSAGNDAAWEIFLTRFRAPLYETAYRVAKDEASARELADELYADLYGIPTDAGRRISKLAYYMGRGSLEGWLRTVLSQRFIDRCRSYAKVVSLEEQAESGIVFAAPEPSADAGSYPLLCAAIQHTLAGLSTEERFLLASYYLDQRTLAEIAAQLGVHESTVSRRLDRLLISLRKHVRQRLKVAGISARRCDELLQDLDVRDLNINVTAELRQEPAAGSFCK
jgi:RNA polymerase sigma-70 factor (ECF subfamily)